MSCRIVAKRKKAVAFLRDDFKGVEYNKKSIVYVPELNEYVKLAKIKNISIISKGSGVNSQISAAKLALVKYIVSKHPEYRADLTKIDPFILTSDGRKNEPKSAQCRGARRRRQKSYR